MSIQQDSQKLEHNECYQLLEINAEKHSFQAGRGGFTQPGQRLQLHCPKNEISKLNFVPTNLMRNDKTLKIRVPAEELESWKKAAVGRELYLSEWVRLVCNDSANPQVPILKN